MRLMLYRPLLSNLWSSHRRKATDASAAASNSGPILSSDALRSSLAVECSIYCVRCAMHLLDITYSTFETEHGTAWWWNALCKFALLLPTGWRASTRGLQMTAYALIIPQLTVWTWRCVDCGRRARHGTILPLSPSFARCRLPRSVLGDMPRDPVQARRRQLNCAKITRAAE